MLRRVFGWEDSTRWDDVAALKQHVSKEQHDKHNERFMYIGEGYFYSEFQGGQLGSMVNWMGQYLEGSLFDWQLGDLLGKAFNACEAGDIRGSFTVADASELSVLAGVLDSRGTLGEHLTARGFKLGLVGEGDVSIKSLMDREKRALRYKLYLQRALAVLWSYAVLCVAANVLSFLGAAPSCGVVAGVQARELLGFGLAGLLLAGKWGLVYGARDFSGHDTSASTVLLLGVSCAMLAAGLGSTSWGSRATDVRKKVN
eukprot:TRINITY_DN6412_c0_g1_i1.p1 TRINITY_DN6412_c0_g1~~TRINITY_DN6412_c0_g1_i1.p1  ORF type:complete len:257 (+),score=86.33 TRINITY_DN6412_c0_g1_i1:155-925(+)